MTEASLHNGVAPAEDITLLNLEFNSSCNLRCKWCSLDHRKARNVMSADVLSRVMSMLAEGQLPNLKRIDLHNGGETLLHPDLPGMLTAIRRARPDIETRAVFSLLTNGMLLTPKVSEQIVRSRAVDQVRFSLDGGTPALFESIRRGASWDTVSSNIVHFTQINRKAGSPVTTEGICMFPLDHPMDTPFAPAFEAVLSLLDNVTLRHPHNWDGSAELDVDDSFFREVADQSEGQVCFLLKNNLVVLPDGSVTVCCNDLNARGVIGSVLDNSLVDLAAHPKRLQRIRLFGEGRKDAIKLCRDCTGFYTRP